MSRPTLGPLKLREILSHPAAPPAPSPAQAEEQRLETTLRDPALDPLSHAEAMLDLLGLKLGLDRAACRSLLSRLRRAGNATDEALRPQVDELFRRVGPMSAESFRVNRLPLLALPDELREVLRQGKIDYSAARTLARVADPERRGALLARTLAGEGSVAGLRQVVAGVVAGASVGEPVIPDGKELSKRCSKLARHDWSTSTEATRAKAVALLARLEGLAR